LKSPSWLDEIIRVEEEAGFMK